MEKTDHEKLTPFEQRVQREFYEEYYLLDRKDQDFIGHQMGDMLMECIWHEEQCFPQ